MGAVSISELRGRHAGETIWLIASGASMNFLRRYRHFFYGKITVAVNETFRDWPTTYAFAHHREPAAEAIARGFTVVASEYCRCDRADGLNVFDGDWYQYKHPQQPTTLVMDMSPAVKDLSDTLVVGSNTVTSAMDFAGRILGAAAVMLCGVDSGSIDGKWNYDGYNGDTGIPRFDGGQPCGTMQGTGLPHVRAQPPLIATVKADLERRGIFVGSLNPFVDFGLEGHVYQR